MNVLFLRNSSAKNKGMFKIGSLINELARSLESVGTQKVLPVSKLKRINLVRSNWMAGCVHTRPVHVGHFIENRL